MTGPVPDGPLHPLPAARRTGVAEHGLHAAHWADGAPARRTIGTHGGVVHRTVVELVIRQTTDAVPRARRFVVDSLADEPAAMREDVELVTSELVTNALLHGGAPVRLRVLRTADAVRLEVEDAGRQAPVPLQPSADAMTGRGLALVAALSTAWGVERGRDGGKVVWAEVGGSPDAPAAAPVLDIAALLDEWADDEPAEERFPVELGAVPTDLLLAAKSHIDNLVREFTLAASAASAPGAAQLPPALADLVQTVVHGFDDARGQIKAQAAASAARGEPETHLRLMLPATAADAGEEYLRALDEADRYARRARLLTLETPPLHRTFRRWYVHALVDQLRAASAGRPPPPVPRFAEQTEAT